MLYLSGFGPALIVKVEPERLKVDVDMHPMLRKMME